MNFKTFIMDTMNTIDINESTVDKIDEYFTLEDIEELLLELDEDEIQEVGEFLIDLIEEDDFDDECDDEGDIDESRFFKKKSNQIKREKKRNVSQRKKDARARKKWYKRNKAKVKRYQKKARRKAKSGKTVGGKRIRTHR